MMRIIPLLLVFLSLTACENIPQVLDTGAQVSAATGYSPAQLNNAVKEALQLSATRAVDELGRSGGYSDNSRWRLQLPESVQSVAGTMRQFGLGGSLDKVESLMNRGAELAAAEAKGVFLEAIKGMTIQNALGIVRGNETAATDYFRATTEAQLSARYKSLMQGQLQQLGFYSQYQQLLGIYKNLPISNKPNLDLEEYAVREGLQALFGQIAEEEKKIRANPLEQGTALVAAIFGNKP
jgi:hypothetical protein